MPTEDDVRAFNTLLDVQDPELRAKMAHALVGTLSADVTELSRIRREAIEEMISGGKTHADVGKILQVSRPRVTQILQTGPRPERAFFGTGPLTCALGAKLEAGRQDGAAQPVVSAEALAAYDLIAEAAKSLKLEITREIIPPPGLVDLNRPNLVVMTSPKLLPFVGQVLEADRIFGFASDGRGWFLVNKLDGTEYLPPDADGPDRVADFAYIGRLPRPSRSGTFLYLAGVHSLGTLGAARYIVDHVADLYSELKTRRFSMLVSVTRDSATSAVEVVPLTTPHRHEGV